MTTREEFVEQAEELGRIMDELRPGTGPGIALLVRQAFDEGAKTAPFKAAEAPGGQAAGDFLLAHPGYEKWPRRSSSPITTLDDIQFDWRTVVKLMQDYAEQAAPAAPSERADEREKFVAWLKSRGTPLHRIRLDSSSEYANNWVQAQWEGWQARAGLSAQEGE